MSTRSKLKAVPEPVCNHPKTKIGVWMPNARGPISVFYCETCQLGYSERYIMLDAVVKEAKAQ